MAPKTRRATGIMFWSPQRVYSPGGGHGGQRNPRVTPQHDQEEQRIRETGVADDGGARRGK